MQEGEDIALLEGKPIEYRSSRSLNEEQVEELNNFALDTLEQESGLSRHTIVKARSGGKVHKRTREILIEAIKILTGDHEK